MKLLKMLAIASFLFLTFTACLYAEGEALAIKALTGRVLIKPAGAAEWSEATAGQIVNEKDSLKTEADSNVLLEFSDKSTVALRPGTEITIEDLKLGEAASKVNINMPIGDLRAILQKMSPDSEFNVKTPMAISGARGTTFYVNATPTSTSVYVTDGAINFYDSVTGETYTITVGMIMTVNADGTIDGPRPATEAEKQAAITTWDVGVLAEPYTEAPPSENTPEPPDVTPENTGDDSKASTT